MQALIESSVSYLSSPEAIASLGRDFYWPKWNSPWWHMSLLREMGETKRIPQNAIQKMVEELDRSPLKIFPIEPGDLPSHVDLAETHCHCGVGNMYQVLATWGIDVDRELPWMRKWLLSYQMADGGLNCDNDAYRVKGECPSSMVATIAPFEAMLLHTKRQWNDDEKRFLDRAAAFLIERQLRLGSRTKHNHEESEKEGDWLKLCFPRFYFYDVLRGLKALLTWADKTGATLPAQAVAPVVSYLGERFPDGEIKKERLSYAGVRTCIRQPDGSYLRGQPASLFPLLEKISAVGEVCPYLTRQWRECLELLRA